jgi:hypothetical protein
MPFHFDIKTVVGRVMKLVRVMRGVPHDFLRDTADIDTRATQWTVFDNRRICAVLGCSLRVREPAAAATNDQKVVPICHSLSPKCFLFVREP